MFGLRWVKEHLRQTVSEHLTLEILKQCYMVDKHQKQSSRGLR